jgi:hypothetical protein
LRLFGGGNGLGNLHRKFIMGRRLHQVECRSAYRQTPSA